MTGAQRQIFSRASAFGLNSVFALSVMREVTTSVLLGRRVAKL